MSMTVQYRIERSFRYIIVALLMFAMVGAVNAGRTTVSAQAATPESASYVPADSLMFVTVDLDVTSTPWLQAGILAQRIDQNLTPEQLFGALASSVLGQQASAIDPQLFLGGEATLIAVDPNLGQLVDEAIPDDVVTMPGSSIDVSVTTSELTEGYVLVTLPLDAAAAEAAMRQALIDQAAIDGVAVAFSKSGEVSITAIPADEASGRPGVAVAQVDDAVIAAATVRELQAVIDVRLSDAPSMAEFELIDTVLAPLPSEYLAIGAINGPAAGAAAGGIDEAGAAADVILPSGTNAFTGFTITAENDGFRLDSRSASTDRTPLAAGGEPFVAELPELLPADTQVMVSGYDFESTQVLDAVVVTLFAVFFGAMEGSVVPLDPAASPEPTAVPTFEEASAEAYQTLALLLGVNLQTDLVQLLDGEFLLGIWGVENADLAVGNAVVIAKTSDPTTVDATVTTLMNFLGLGAPDLTGAAGATPESTGGTGLTEIDLSGGGTELAPLAIGVVNDALIIAYGGGADVAINGSDDRLVDTALFGDATAGLPSERNSLTFINLGALESSLAGTGAGSFVAAGQAFAVAGFQDGELAGMQGILYIPEPE
jgi:hypothetical protein